MKRSKQKTDQRPRPPLGLSSRSQRLWRELVEAFDFSTAEEVLLEELCRQHDILLAARAEVAEHGVVINDQRGSRKSNPAVRQTQHATALILRLANKLKLFEAPSAVPPRLRALVGGA